MPEEMEKQMKVILQRVPYYSQFVHVKNPDWKLKSCTMACLKMAMEYVLSSSQPSIDDLFRESEFIQQDMVGRGLLTTQATSHGRTHDTIVKVAHNHGCLAHPEEFRSVSVNEDGTFGPSSYSEAMLEAGIGRLCQSIANNSPVIVSVSRKFEVGGTPHSVLIIGFEKDSGFYYRDPDSEEEESVLEGSFISLAGFKQHWRRLAIFVDALPK